MASKRHAVAAGAVGAARELQRSLAHTHAMKIILTALMIGLISAAASGQETLEPCSDLLTSNSIQLVLTSRLVENLGVSPRNDQSKGQIMVRMFVFPAWDNDGESVVAVYLPESGDAIVETSVAEKGIVGSNVELVPIPNQEKPTFYSDVKPKAQQVNVRKFQATIQREIGESIGKVFAKEIRRVRYPSDEEVYISLHVTSYTFTSWIQGLGDVCGHISSPKDGTRVGRMVAFGEALIRYSQSGKVQQEHELKELTKRLALLND